MANNLVLDAQLSKDSYTVNNSSSGSVNGWARMRVTEYKLPTTVESGSNFAAQMYQGEDGSYKIAFRGTASLTSKGDLTMNGSGIVAGNWTPEMQQAMDFTLQAIQQVAKEKGIEFKDAAKLFTVTGHSQGGFEAELVAKMFGLPGTSQDGPGASRMVGTTGYQAAKAAIAAQESGAVLDGAMSDFVARQYTLVVGGVNPHLDGVTVSASAVPLVLSGLMSGSSVGALGGVVLQAAVFHKLDNIIAIEKAREQYPWLQKYVQTDDAGDGALSLASVVSDRWASVQVAGGGVGVSANDVHGVLSDFLATRAGQAVSVQEFEKTLYVQASNGDTLILMADGSGVSTSVQGIQLMQKEYTKGGYLSKTVQAQQDDDGNLLVQTESKGFSFVGTEDASGRMTNGVYKTFDDNGQLISTSNAQVSYSQDGQATKVTETINHLAQGSQIASSKELVTSGGARIVNSTTADGHITEDTYATVNGQQTLQSSKVISYSQAERDTATLDVSLAGLELMQALRAGNKVQAAASLIRLVNSAEIASNQMPTLGAIGTGFSGAVSIVSALDSWGDASDGERIALTARAVLGANEVAKAFSADGNTGFLQNSQALGALRGEVALANLDDVLESGNPFAIASTFMSIANSAALVMQQAAMFGPQVMIAVAIASIVFGSLFSDDIEYPAPPPAGTAEIGHLADGSLGLLIKDSDGHINEERSLTGQVLVRSYPQDSYSDESGGSYSQDRTVYNNQDWGLGASVLSQRLSGLITELQAQAVKDGTHLLLERLPSVSVHGYPSFDGNGVNNFFFALQFNNPASGARQMLATAHQDLAAQFKEVASYAGALVGETEWAQIQAKLVAGNTYATETEGQYVDRQSGDQEGDSLLTQEQAKAQADSNRQTYSLLTLDLEGDGIARRAKAEAGIDLDSVKADTTKGITRLDVDNDGYMELTEWVGSKEAILGIDRNGDGRLSAATELLTGGELSDAAEALGLKRLAFFDANVDGKLDKLDTYFNSFKLWLDINGDARTGVGEVYGLADAGIQSIDVNTGAVNQSNWLCAA